MRSNFPSGQTLAGALYRRGDGVHGQQITTTGSQQLGKAAVGAGQLQSSLVLLPRQSGNAQCVLPVFIPARLEAPRVRVSRVQLLKVGECERHPTLTLNSGVRVGLPVNSDLQ